MTKVSIYRTSLAILMLIVMGAAQFGLFHWFTWLSWAGSALAGLYLGMTTAKAELWDKYKGFEDGGCDD